MTQQTIILNMIPNGPLPIVYASKYDNQTNAVTFHLYNDDLAFTLPDGAAVLINGTKPDGKGFSYSAASWSGSTVVCNITTQMTAVKGDVLCELRIRTSSQIIGSLNFILRVEPSALDDDSVLSETDIPLIEQAIEIAANLADYIQTAVDSATTATAAAAAATAAAQRSEIINTNVEGIYDDLVDATAAANEAAEAATDAADALSNLSATANTLTPGSSATAVYDPATKRFTFGIPRGATGASGVYTEISGWFAMSVDANGDLYAHCNNSELTAANFNYNSETGDLYYVIPEGD